MYIKKFSVYCFALLLAGSFLHANPKIVGLVPARNESPIIQQCLRALALYTDAIVYLDDASTDDTLDKVRSVAQECNVEKIIAKEVWYRDEPGDRNKLLQAGRDIGGTHFIVIDADEMITANCLKNNYLRNIILSLKPGDKLKLNWIHLWRSVDEYRCDGLPWSDNYKSFIFCDDRACFYQSSFIHTSRTPRNLVDKTFMLSGSNRGVLHFQFVNWQASQIQQCWYRCLERIRNPHKSITKINDKYTWRKNEKNLKTEPSKPAWFNAYKFFDPSVYMLPEQWRKKQVLEWLQKYGHDFFSELDIWDVDWRTGTSIQADTSIKNTFTVEPITLLTPSRFDITAKYLYAQHRDKNVRCDWAFQVYKNHLIALNNLYELSPPKSNIDHFVKAFHETLESIERNQFDPEQSIIPIDADGIPHNGSHRAASCILHNVKPTCKIHTYESTGFYFFSSYLKNRGLEQKYLDAMALEYCMLKKNTYIVIVMPAAVDKDKKIVEMMNNFGTIVYRKNVLLNQNGSVNFTKHIYAQEPWLGTWNNNFAGAREKANACFPQENRKNNPMRVFLFECESLKKVQACKKVLRALFDLENHSVHINDTHTQSIDLARIVFVKNSIHFLNNAAPKNFSRFWRHLSIYKKWLSENNVDPDCFCVDSSAIMSAYGLRDCSDLDYLCHNYDNLKCNDRWIDNHNSEMHYHTKTKDDILFHPNNYFWYQGVKFGALDVVRSMKIKRNEAKDRTDVAMINRLLNKV